MRASAAAARSATHALLLAAAVPVLVRLRDTEAELNEARDEGVYGTRVAAFWATVGTAGALALALFFFWRDAAFAAITRSARTGTTVKATSRMQADARREWNRLRGITTGAGAGASPVVSVMTICNTGSLATAGYGTALGVVRALHEAKALRRVFACETYVACFLPSVPRPTDQRINPR